MSTKNLLEKFAIENVLEFSDVNGLTRATISHRDCAGELFLQGAHVTKWQPAGKESVLFLSSKVQYQSGKAIRGGIPIIFPWFGPRTANSVSSRTDGPAHGFARTSVWSIESVENTDQALRISLVLEPTEATRALGFDEFDCQLTIAFGGELQLSLAVTNRSAHVMVYEAAFHSYLQVHDAEKMSIEGLQDTDYLDKTDGGKRKRQTEEFLSLTGETDRPYLSTTSDIQVREPNTTRTIQVSKQQSRETVIWNPWRELTAKMSDMGPDDWKSMVCVEAANLGEDAIRLEPGLKHTMSCILKATS